MVVAILSLILSYHRFPRHVVSIVHGIIVLCIFIVFETPKIVFWASGPVRISRFLVWKCHNIMVILSFIFFHDKFAKEVVSIVHGTTVLFIYIVFETAKILFWASAPMRISRFRVWKRHDKAAILSLIFSYHKFTKHVVSIVHDTNVWMTS